MRRLLQLSAAAAAILLVQHLATPSAFAEFLLVAVEGTQSGQDFLYRIDPTTGTSTTVGPLVGPPRPEIPGGLAFDTFTSSLYLIDESGGSGPPNNAPRGGLYTVNPSTGAVSLVGATIDPNGWQGLASDPNANGALYGSRFTGSLVDADLYRIGFNGLPTRVGNIGSAITALEFDPSGKLWGIDFDTGRFGTIDKSTAIFTQIGTTLPGFQGLAFDPNGTMYAINSNDKGLYTINTMTGAARLIGITSTRFPKGLAFIQVAPVPEPPSAVLMGLGTLGLIGYSWHRRATRV